VFATRWIVTLANAAALAGAALASWKGMPDSQSTNPAPDESADTSESPSSGTRVAWLVARDGGSFVAPSGDPVGLGRRGTLQRLLLALASARIDSCGRSLSQAELIDAAWPGDRSSRDSALNRLAFSMSELRRLGLRKLIERTPQGYRFDPEQHVAWLDPAQRTGTAGCAE
jgi:hypothetical protein